MGRGSAGAKRRQRESELSAHRDSGASCERVPFPHAPFPLAVLCVFVARRAAGRVEFADLRSCERRGGCATVRSVLL